MVSNGKADLPIEEQVSWRLPISVMLNMTLLRSTQPVITVSEYLRLHNIPEHMEESDGHWGRQKYHVNPSVFTDTGRAPGLHVIENELYDSKGINRVDVIPDDMKKRGGWSPEGGDYLRGQRGMWLDTPKTIVYRALQAALPESPRVLEWDRVRQILEKAYSLGGHVDDEMERILRENGWEVLYTYNGV
jgi:hypothetical protein